ncbi:beta-glucanase (GH16 family) [Bradyrhizobium sp. AZCC 1610]
MHMRFFLLLLLIGLPTFVRAETGDELNLSDFTQTFTEDFDSLAVSAWGPGTRWIAHTPWNGDFGSAVFVDPKPGFPFTTRDGHLRIEAAKGADEKWRSGLLASVDRSGVGFAQQFGYFEMRAKFPAGNGLWPAFWLIGLDRSTHTSEVDVVEHYGHMPARYTASIHVFDRKEPKKSRTIHQRVNVPVNSLYEGFHTYGVKTDSEWTRFYFDRREVASVPTPAEHRQPMYMLIDLGLGAGWPIEEAPNPSYMYVDYVRVWQKR